MNRVELCFWRAASSLAGFSFFAHLRFLPCRSYGKIFTYPFAYRRPQPQPSDGSTAATDYNVRSGAARAGRLSVGAPNPAAKVYGVGKMKTRYTHNLPTGDKVHEAARQWANNRVTPQQGRRVQQCLINMIHRFAPP